MNKIIIIIIIIIISKFTGLKKDVHIKYIASENDEGQHHRK